MTPEQFGKDEQLEDLRRQLSEAQALVDRLLDCQEAHLREIDNLNTAQESAEQRAEHWQELAAKSHETASQLLAERDALQARIDGALAMLDEQSGNPFGSQYYNEEIEFYEGMRESLQRLLSGKSDRYLKAVEILTGEGEA